MKLSEFHYDLPKELVAQEPLKTRDRARLMVLERRSGVITEKLFKDIVCYLRDGDCIVLNDTRVVSVRLYGKRKTGGKVEIFLLNPGAEKLKALICPSKKIREGEWIELENGIKACVFGAAELGRFVEFDAPIDKVLEGGHVPLPPYITRGDVPQDAEDYQTVYASKSGATASPTAGLHFSRRLIKRLEKKGVAVVFVTLHTSYGTFAPVTEENIEDHKMHSEYFEITAEAAEVVNKTRSSGGRVIAVGTTSARALESSAIMTDTVEASSGETDIFIYPPYRFKIIDSIITNFHLPGSTLLMMIGAFAGRQFMFKAYKKAIEERFRFFSYGDAMMIL